MKIVVMGVSGSGKSSIGAALAVQLGARFLDADDLHPPENVAAMAAGQALSDEMRWPWLAQCGAALAEADSVVLACSALRRSYRDVLRAAAPDLRLVYPAAERALIEARMRARQGHYMPVSLLDSQFETLEPPHEEEAPIVVSVAPKIDDIVAEVLALLAA